MIRVGASGWSYDDWVGPFYPVALRERPAEWLSYYASRFSSVEIHSTFDAFPSDDLVEDWARQGVALQESPESEGFEYSLKLSREVTHQLLPAGEVAAARDLTGRFDREVLDPLAGEGLLGAVLVQLPPGFAPSPERIAALQEVIGALAERRVAIEFRDPRWFERGCVVLAAERLFASQWVALVEQDSPAVPRALPPIAARHAYIRLHGRRADRWLGLPLAAQQARAKHDGTRYDYLYDEDELRPIAERAALLDASRKDVRVYFNNTPGAKAVANALDLLRMVGSAPADAPRPRLTQQTRLPS